tara:strand:+ start:114 stop:560 length:447 start_codon:yes stop_codon:yes gene_type:complete
MTGISLKKTNRFSIKQINRNMKVILKKTMTKKFFFNSIKNLNDTAPIHTHDKWAKRLGFKKKIFPGLAVVSVFSKLIGMYLPGKNAVIMSINFSFKQPVYENDKLTYICKVDKVIKSINVVLLKLIITKKNKEIIIGNSKCKILNSNV